MRGKYLTVDGGEGIGKTTQLNLLEESVKAAKVPYVRMREPGETFLGEGIRAILLDPRHKRVETATEVLMFFGDRAQTRIDIIEPALAAGKLVISDRSWISTWVYQGYAGGFPCSTIEKLARIAYGGIVPDLSVIMTLDPKIGLIRAKARGKLDRFEQKAQSFHAKVQEGMKHYHEQYPERSVLIDAAASILHIHHLFIDTANSRLELALSPAASVST